MTVETAFELDHIRVAAVEPVSIVVKSLPVLSKYEDAHQLSFVFHEETEKVVCEHKAEYVSFGVTSVLCRNRL